MSLQEPENPSLKKPTLYRCNRDDLTNRIRLKEKTHVRRERSIRTSDLDNRWISHLFEWTALEVVATARFQNRNAALDKQARCSHADSALAPSAQRGRVHHCSSLPTRRIKADKK